MDLYKIPLVNTDWCEDADIVRGVNFVHFSVLNPAYIGRRIDLETITHLSFVRIGNESVGDLTQRFHEELQETTDVRLVNEGMLRADSEKRELRAGEEDTNSRHVLRLFEDGVIVHPEKPELLPFTHPGVPDLTYPSIHEQFELKQELLERDLVDVLTREPSVVYGVDPKNYERETRRETKFIFIEQGDNFYVVPQHPLIMDVWAYSSKQSICLVEDEKKFWRFSGNNLTYRPKGKMPTRLDKKTPWIYRGNKKEMLEKFQEAGHSLISLVS